MPPIQINLEIRKAGNSAAETLFLQKYVLIELSGSEVYERNFCQTCDQVSLCFQAVLFHRKFMYI